MADTEAQQESTNAGQSDIDILTEFCREKKITQQAIEELIKKGYTILDAFELVDMEIYSRRRSFLTEATHSACGRMFKIKKSYKGTAAGNCGSREDRPR